VLVRVSSGSHSSEVLVSSGWNFDLAADLGSAVWPTRSLFGFQCR
jgi:hypothetical protein